MAPLPRMMRVLAVRWLGLPLAVRALAPIVVMVSLWISSSISPTPRPPNVLRGLLHNAAHVVAYAILASCWLLTHSPSRLLASAPAARSMAWRSMLLATAYGVVDEWHQSFVDRRVCSIGDLLSDASGAALAVAALFSVLHPGPARRLVPWCAVACVVSVAIATWLPW